MQLIQHGKCLIPHQGIVFLYHLLKAFSGALFRTSLFLLLSLIINQGEEEQSAIHVMLIDHLLHILFDRLCIQLNLIFLGLFGQLIICVLVVTQSEGVIVLLSNQLLQAKANFVVLFLYTAIRFLEFSQDVFDGFCFFIFPEKVLLFDCDDESVDLCDQKAVQEPGRILIGVS